RGGQRDDQLAPRRRASRRVPDGVRRLRGVDGRGDIPVHAALVADRGASNNAGEVAAVCSASQLTESRVRTVAMFDWQGFASTLGDTWPTWVVTVTLVVAAVIDGLQLKVPNWITFPMIISGWVYSATLSPYPGWEGLWYSLLGTAVGLALLLPAYAI